MWPNSAGAPFDRSKWMMAPGPSSPHIGSGKFTEGKEALREPINVVIVDACSRTPGRGQGRLEPDGGDVGRLSRAGKGTSSSGYCGPEDSDEGLHPRVSRQCRPTRSSDEPVRAGTTKPRPVRRALTGTRGRCTIFVGSGAISRESEVAPRCRTPACQPQYVYL
jgi:hypothetical protein